jgi:hypothetical protein
LQLRIFGQDFQDGRRFGEKFVGDLEETLVYNL